MTLPAYLPFHLPCFGLCLACHQAASACLPPLPLTSTPYLPSTTLLPFLILAYFHIPFWEAHRLWDQIWMDERGTWAGLGLEQTSFTLGDRWWWRQEPISPLFSVTKHPACFSMVGTGTGSVTAGFCSSRYVCSCWLTCRSVLCDLTAGPFLFLD